MRPGSMLVVTRDVQLRTVIEPQGREPYLAVALWFDPERVARALLRLAELTASEEQGDVSPAFTMDLTAGIASGIERLLDAIADPIDSATIAPLILDGTVLPVGVISGALGAPFLLWLLVTSNRKEA